jgi:hypothetical protein
MARRKKPSLHEDLHRAVVLAKSLKAIDDAYFKMDAVFFNPSGWLVFHDEIRDKIVELLAGSA